MKAIHALRDEMINGKLTAEALREEIQERKDMLPQLIGWLYPRVMRDEIAELQGMLAKLNG